jgi:hypothetical protein
LNHDDICREEHCRKRKQHVQRPCGSEKDMAAAEKVMGKENPLRSKRLKEQVFCALGLLQDTEF